MLLKQWAKPKQIEKIATTLHGLLRAHAENHSPAASSGGFFCRSAMAAIA